MTLSVETRWGDASHHSGAGDWAGWVSGNHATAFVHKCTEGASFTDALYARARTIVRAQSGVVFGGYHYADPNLSSGTSQAARFAAAAGLRAGELAVIDAESSGGMSQAAYNRWLRDWLTYVQAHSPATRVLYGPRTYYASDTFAGLGDLVDFGWVPGYPGLSRWPTSVAAPLSAGNRSGIPADRISWQWSDNVGGIDATVSPNTGAELRAGAASGLDLTMGQYESIMAAIAAVPKATLMYNDPAWYPNGTPIYALLSQAAKADDALLAIAKLPTADDVAAAVVAKLGDVTGGTVDVAAIAKAVCDELAARVAS